MGGQPPKFQFIVWEASLLISEDLGGQLLKSTGGQPPKSSEIWEAGQFLKILEAICQQSLLKEEIGRLRSRGSQILPRSLHFGSFVGLWFDVISQHPPFPNQSNNKNLNALCCWCLQLANGTQLKNEVETQCEKMHKCKAKTVG